MELNNIRNRNFVYEGQVLALASSARAAPPVEAEVPVEVVASAPAPEPAAVAEAAEPASEREAEEIGPTLVPGTQAADVGRSERLLGRTTTTRSACRRPRRSATTPNGWTCAPASCASSTACRSPRRSSIGRKVKLRFLQGHAGSVRSAARGVPPAAAGSVLHAVPHQGHRDARDQVGRVDLGARAAALQHSDLAAAPVQPGSRSRRRSSPGTKLVIPIVEPTGCRGARRRHEMLRLALGSRSSLLCSGCMTRAALRRPEARARRGRAHQRRPALHRRLAADGHPAAGRRPQL